MLAHCSTRRSAARRYEEVRGIPGHLARSSTRLGAVGAWLSDPSGALAFHLGCRVVDQDRGSTTRDRCALCVCDLPLPDGWGISVVEAFVSANWYLADESGHGIPWSKDHHCQVSRRCQSASAGNPETNPGVVT